MPSIGDRVFVIPRKDLNVQRGERAFGQFIAVAGEDLVWDEFLGKRLEAGEVSVRAIAVPVADEGRAE